VEGIDEGNIRFGWNWQPSQVEGGVDDEPAEVFREEID